jgi:hypothetical protein
MDIKSESGFIIYPGERKHMKIWPKEEVINRVKSKKPTDVKEKLKHFRLKYEKILNSMYIEFNKEEEFWNKIEQFADNGNFGKYKFMLNQVVKKCYIIICQVKR